MIDINTIMHLVSAEKAEFINKLLTLTGDEIYAKYGYKRDETITETVKFNDNTEMDIKLVICDGKDKPYTEAVLFDENGTEQGFTDPCDEFLGEWNIDDYTAVILTSK